MSARLMLAWSLRGESGHADAGGGREVRRMGPREVWRQAREGGCHGGAQLLRTRVQSHACKYVKDIVRCSGLPGYLIMHQVTKSGVTCFGHKKQVNAFWGPQKH